MNKPPHKHVRNPYWDLPLDERPILTSERWRRIAREVERQYEPAGGLTATPLPTISHKQFWEDFCEEIVLRRLPIVPTKHLFGPGGEYDTEEEQ